MTATATQIALEFERSLAATNERLRRMLAAPRLPDQPKSAPPVRLRLVVDNTQRKAA